MEVIAAWDAKLLLLIQEHLRTALGDLLLPVWSNLGNAGLIWIAAAVILLCFRKTRRAGAVALGGMLFSLLFVNGILKHLVSRTRPWLVVEGLQTLLRSNDPNSFPSGHTSAAFALCLRSVRNAGPDLAQGAGGGCGGADGVVPPLCGRPLSQRCAGGGGDWDAVRPAGGRTLPPVPAKAVSAELNRPGRAKRAG